MVLAQVCPVDCIHCVPLDMLPVLEHIMPFCVKNEVPGRDPSRLHQVHSSCCDSLATLSL